jgi:hypothetical protein
MLNSNCIKGGSETHSCPSAFLRVDMKLLRDQIRTLSDGSEVCEGLLNMLYDIEKSLEKTGSATLVSSTLFRDA